MRFGAFAEKKGNPMQILVITVSAVIVLSVLLATVVAFKSIPDIRSYRRPERVNDP